jgi:hypothetical protein
MSVSDITTAVSANPIKNGDSLVLVNKNGSSITLDTSKEVEQGLDTFSNLTENRFDDVTYYIASRTTA